MSNHEYQKAADEISTKIHGKLHIFVGAAMKKHGITEFTVPLADVLKYMEGNETLVMHMTEDKDGQKCMIMRNMTEAQVATEFDPKTQIRSNVK